MVTNMERVAEWTWFGTNVERTRFGNRNIWSDIA